MLKLLRLLLPLTLLSLPALPAFASHNGNGLPHGSMKGSFNLQIIAFENCPAGDFTDSNRHMIAIKADFTSEVNTGTSKEVFMNDDLLKRNTIALAQGDDFQVTDGNACKGGGANMTLPLSIDNLDCSATPEDPSCPDPTFTEYKVYVRLVGKPGSKLDASTCGAEIDPELFGDPDTLEILCSTESTVDLARTSGKNGRPKFRDYTKELLTVCLALDETGECTLRTPLFGDVLSDYMWKLDTEGRAHAQLRFVPVLP